jgi:hypothetical protein
MVLYMTTAQFLFELVYTIFTYIYQWNHTLLTSSVHLNDIIIWTVLSLATISALFAFVIVIILGITYIHSYIYLRSFYFILSFYYLYYLIFIFIIFEKLLLI